VAKPAQKRFISFIIVLSALAFLGIQGQEYSFRHLNVDDGLPSNF
jgi:hypothetical protein